jgi:hypothetical protein
MGVVRIVGGIVLVTYQHHMDSKGWTIAAVAFQGAGVFPLLIVQVGYLMIVYVHVGDCAMANKTAMQMMRRRTGR